VGDEHAGIVCYCPQICPTTDMCLDLDDCCWPGGANTRCICGHLPVDHTYDGICTAKLSTFPDGGFHGVCPCTPSWVEAQRYLAKEADCG
jgi:hypothetical protein